MARIKKGINGAFSGKVGKVVGGSWNGIDYIRSLPTVTKPRSEAQLKNEYIFKVTQDWLQPIKEFLDVGFKGYSRTVYGINAAKSLLYKTALIKDGYNSRVDPTLAVVSHGELPMANQMLMELDAAKQLNFSWDPSLEKGMSAFDTVILLAHNPETGTPKYSVNGAYRKAGADTLDMSKMAAGIYYVYSAFVAQDRCSQSMSQYLGTVEIPGLAV